VPCHSAIIAYGDVNPTDAHLLVTVHAGDDEIIEWLARREKRRSRGRRAAVGAREGVEVFYPVTISRQKQNWRVARLACAGVWDRIMDALIAACWRLDKSNVAFGLIATVIASLF
jgi:hypothetical protein